MSKFKVLVEPLLLICWWPPSCYVLAEERVIWCSSCLSKVLIPLWAPTHNNSPKPNYLPKAQPPDTIVLGIWVFNIWISRVGGRWLVWGGAGGSFLLLYLYNSFLVPAAWVPPPNKPVGKHDIDHLELTQTLRCTPITDANVSYPAWNRRYSTRLWHRW